MDLDQIHPSGGNAEPNPLEAQERLKKQKLEDTAKSLPVIEDILADLDKLIASANSLDGLSVESKIPLEVQILAKKELIKFAEIQKRSIETKYKNYIKAVGK